MGPVNITIGVLLLIMAVFLIVSILMQSGKSKKLSGTIAGGAETFFGKEKGQALNKRLSMVTNVVAIIFVALVLTLFLLSSKPDDAGRADESSVVSGNVSDEASVNASVDASADTSANASADTSANASADASADASAEDTTEEASK